MNKKNIFQLVLVLGDIILMYLSLFLVLALRYRDFSLTPGPQTGQFFFHFSILHFFWFLLLFSFDFYEFGRVKNKLFFPTNLALFAILAFGLGAMYFYLNLHSLIEPKTILLEDILLFLLFAWLWRQVLVLLLNQKKFKTKVAVAGWHPKMQELIDKYLAPENYEIAAVFEKGAFGGLEKIKIFSNFKKFIETIREEKIDLIIFSDDSRAEQASWGGFLDLAPKIKITGLKDFYEKNTGKIPLDLISEAWLLENISKSGEGNYSAAKRAFDIILSLAGLIVTVILFPFIFLAIKIDSPGSVFYIQERKGKGGKIFLLYKFRTMKETSDQYRIWRASDGSQVTRAGIILKKFHIDEFPQFYNILKGDLSFVGPRPEWVKLAADYENEIRFYRYRYLVRPGFTGWAQINYHASNSAEEAKEKFMYDLYYMKNRSFLLDISIVLKTIQLFFR